MPLKLFAKNLIFPGFDLHTRLRCRLLSKLFLPGAIDTLDAGCGNGALSYEAYKKGSRVLGVTNEPDLVEKNSAFFAYRKVEPGRMEFRVCDLYDLPKLNRTFDQIICSETIEHIVDDKRIIGYFWQMLKPGGVLHLCAPNALHPAYRLGLHKTVEDGDHVRDGYTLESYRSLLEPLGFKITRTLGLGSPALVRLDAATRSVRNRFGHCAALPVFILSLPFLAFERANPGLAFSLYVTAVKPKD